MLIIDTRESDSIDKALKKYKKKFEKSRTLRELRRRQVYIKPSVRKRNLIMKAAYREEMKRKMEG